MEGLILCQVLITILILPLSTQLVSSTATRPLPTNRNTEYIRKSCNSTLYPHLCYRTLSIYASKIKTNPEELVHTALNISLKATNSTGRLMKRLHKISGLKPREAAALVDCIEVVGDSVDELRRSIKEMSQMSHAKGSRFGLLLSDIKTWVSASLTDDETCMDGFEGMKGNVEILVRRHVLRVARLTSNALALVNSCVSPKANLP